MLPLLLRLWAFVPELWIHSLIEVLEWLSLIGACDFEKNFDSQKYTSWVASHWWIPILAIVIYLIVIFGGKKIMNEREAFDLKVPLALWNICLSLFSFLGALRTGPYLIAMILKTSIIGTQCDNTWYKGHAGCWALLMMVSKFPELIDTIFVVLRKKDLIFLHWYHHVTVLLFCWQSFIAQPKSGIYFVAMNYSVHAVMYFYYFLQACKIRAPKWVPPAITSMQITQMVIGTMVCIGGWILHFGHEGCETDVPLLIAGALMYGSYFYLFSVFAVKRYGPSEKEGEKKKTSVAKEKTSSRSRSVSRKVKDVNNDPSEDSNAKPKRSRSTKAKVKAN
jgi:elongation of very long chain fatty acids protein 6